jgi:adenine deaminase
MKIRVSILLPSLLSSLLWIGALQNYAFADDFKVTPAPARHEGQGPYSQLILREVTVIDGTGAPAYGPADIVIEGNKIREIVIVGTPTSAVRGNRPKLKEGGREITLSGHYVMPGIIDMHGHIGGAEQGTPAEYVYKL